MHRLLTLNDQLAKDYASRFEGEVLEVIPEESLSKIRISGLYVGYTDNYLKVVLPQMNDDWSNCESENY